MYYSSILCWWPLQIGWTQIRPGKALGLIWTQYVWYSQELFEKDDWKNNSRQQKSKPLLPSRCRARVCTVWQDIGLMLVKAAHIDLLVSSVYHLCKQVGPRSGQSKNLAWSGSKLIDTLMEETPIRPHILFSDLGLHCLSVSSKQDTGPMFINCCLLIILANGSTRSDPTKQTGWT